MTTNDYHDLAENIAMIVPTIHEKLGRLSRLPLPPNHFITIVALSQHKCLTITELCNMLTISKQQMSPIIDKLEKYHYIKRTVNPTDRRSSKIMLAPAGLEILLKQHRNIVGIFEKQLSTLTLNHEEISELSQSVQKFLDLCKKI